MIDINMGCPAKRVTGGFAGSALMRDLDLAVRLIRAVVAAVKVPVSVKMRLGWDEAALNAPELARRAASRRHCDADGARPHALSILPGQSRLGRDPTGESRRRRSRSSPMAIATASRTPMTCCELRRRCGDDRPRRGRTAVVRRRSRATSGENFAPGAERASPPRRRARTLSHFAVALWQGARSAACAQTSGRLCRLCAEVRMRPSFAADFS